MIITDQSIRSLNTGFSASFQKGFTGTESHYRDIAMVVPSSTRSNTYGWLGQFPKMREWIGDRIVKNLAAHGYVILNRSFENTVAVPRDDIEDDQFGVYGPMIEQMGAASAELPDELTFGLLRAGFQTQCYDGQFFFDTDHPVGPPGTNNIVSVSNTSGGDGPAWYLLDTSRPMKPILFQERRPFSLIQMTDPGMENVFLRKEYLYGTDGRCNVGYGLWQLAYASKQPLDAAHYEEARATMMNQRGDEGRILGVKPTLLVVPPELEKAGRSLINSALLDGGGTNPWAGSATLLTTPWIA